MKTRTVRRFFNFFIVAAIVGILFAQTAQAAKLSPTLQKQLPSLANNASVGLVIVSFKTSSGLNSTHLNVLRSVGVTSGQTFPTLGMVATTLNAGQIRTLAAISRLLPNP